MAETFIIKRGDTSPAIRYSLAPAVDLAGASVAFQMRARQGTIITNATAVIDSFDPPIVRYSWTPEDTETAGNFQAEFVVTYGDGSIETFPNVGFIAVVIGEDVR